MRKTIVAGNWKMNKTPSEAVELIEKLKSQVDTDKVDVVFCVPYINLVGAAQALKGTSICLGAQNMFYEESGAFTGEISPSMLKEVGVEYVIIGHSERRAYFGETDETVNKKIKKALEHELIPILCVGETLEQREEGIELELISIQVKKALLGLDESQAKKVVIAYEPIWAIGTGKTATSNQAEEICGAIRNVVKDIYCDDVAQTVRIQYGGSVNESNASEIFSMENIDGGLVGGASLKDEFIKIVNY